MENTFLVPIEPRECAQAKCALDSKYAPNFSKAFEHFLLHTGGRGVIEDLEKNLRLSPKQAQASKDTLLRFGNTSAASTWYILARIESTVGVRKGDRIWQLGPLLSRSSHHRHAQHSLTRSSLTNRVRAGFGGGFKCNSAVWKARRNVKQGHDCWA